jgi:hypothetical protein
MTSRRYLERISIEIHQTTDGVGEFVTLCKRRAFVDERALLIEIVGDPTTEVLEYQNTRIVWHRRGGDKVLNLNGIFVTTGRRPLVQFQAVSELFENSDANTPRLTDIDGVEAIFET